jgi:hypothetical protein
VGAHARIIARALRKVGNKPLVASHISHIQIPSFNQCASHTLNLQWENVTRYTWDELIYSGYSGFILTLSTTGILDIEKSTFTTVALLVFVS